MQKIEQHRRCEVVAYFIDGERWMRQHYSPVSLCRYGEPVDVGGVNLGRGDGGYLYCRDHGEFVEVTA